MRHPGPLRLRRGINLRAYGQRDPLSEYKREAFELFEAMLANLRQHVTSVLSDVELRVEPAPMMAMAGGEPEEAMAEEARHRHHRPACGDTAASRTPGGLGQSYRPRRAAARGLALALGAHPEQRTSPLRLWQEI